jgi:Flp pilus assembly protein CpaB
MLLLAPALLSLAFADDPNKQVVASLPEGHVAYSIKFEPKPVTGSVTPGDKVDVVLVERAAQGKTKAYFVLKQALVVAVDTAETRKESVHTATLAVKPDDAKILVESEKKGKLTLMLRPPEPAAAKP